MNMFKLRYSYGKVGNDVVGDNDQRFPYLSTFGASGGFNYADIGQKYEFTGLSYTHYATTAVTWEIATKHDIGIDFSLWDDKFTGQLTISTNNVTVFTNNVISFPFLLV